MGYQVAQQQTSEPLLFLMVLASDHISPATGLSPTVTLSKNGAAFASPDGAVSEVGNGWYKVAGSAVDSDTVGPLLLHATAGTADPTDEQYDVVLFNPTVSTAAGVSTGSAFTGLDLITAALKTIGVLAAGETPSNEDAADALLRLNDLIDAWATQRLTIYAIVRTTKTLTAAVTSYTIGSGGAINIVRPTEIDHAGLIIDTTATLPVEIPLRILTDDEYALIAIKTLTSPLVQGIYYDKGWTSGLATISVHPIPTVSTTQLVLYCPTALQAMTLTTGYAFPPGYARLLRYGLACELCEEFGVPLSAQVDAKYREALADVKRANTRITEMSLDPGLWGQSGVYNIYSDQNT
jgi:hypothetical protein